nr:homeobox protein [Hymenolepis microstoma]
MLGSADRDALCSLSILLGNHRNALSCAVKPLSTLLLPDKYAPCMVPTIPSPKELLSSNWGLSRPREYVKLLEGLVSSWRIFATKREVHVGEDSSYPSSVNNDTPGLDDLTELDEGTCKESSSCSPPNSPSTTNSLLSSNSSGAVGTTSSSHGARLTPASSIDASRGGSDSPDIGRSRSNRTKRYRKARAYFQPHHLCALEGFYKQQTYLSTHDRELLAQRLNLSEDRIRTWFQNRRMKEKRKPRTSNASSVTALNLSVNKGVM